MQRSRIRALVIGCSAFGAVLLALFLAPKTPESPGAPAAEDTSGQVAIVHFWATWCAPCIEELPALNRLQADYGGRGLTVRLFSLDVGREGRPAQATVDAFLHTHGLSHLTSAVDDDGAMQRRYGAKSLPHSTIIGPDGAVIAIFQEAVAWDSPQIRGLIDERLPAQ